MSIIAILAAGALQSASQQVPLDTTPRNATFYVGFTAGADSVEVYVRLRGNRPVFIARHTQLDRADVPARWADGDNCPGLQNVTEAFGRVNLGQIWLPNLSRDEGVRNPFPRSDGSVPLNGPIYTIWGKAQQFDGAFADVRVTATSGQIAAFGRYATAQMSNCWHANEP